MTPAALLMGDIPLDALTHEALTSLAGCEAARASASPPARPSRTPSLSSLHRERVASHGAVGAVAAAAATSGEKLRL